MNKKPIGFTLIELVIYIILLSIIILAVTSFEIFSHEHVIAAGRRTTIQNDISFILEHMKKNMARAIGDDTGTGANQPVTITPGDPLTMVIKVDANSDGRLDAVPPDARIRYRWRSSGSGAYEIRYWPDYQTGSPSGAGILLSNRIADCSFTHKWVHGEADNDNYVSVAITGCWQPANAASAGNPCVSMNSRIYLPAVSTH